MDEVHAIQISPPNRPLNSCQMQSNTRNTWVRGCYKITMHGAQCAPYRDMKIDFKRKQEGE